MIGALQIGLGARQTTSASSVPVNIFNTKYAISSVAYSESNLRAAWSATTDLTAILIAPKSSGKWAFEGVVVAQAGTNSRIGVLDMTALPAPSVGIGNDAAGYGFISNSGNKITGASSVAYASAWTLGDIITVLGDFDGGNLSFATNGVDNGVAYTGLAGSFIPAVGETNSQNVDWRIASALTYSFSGYSLWR